MHVLVIENNEDISSNLFDFLEAKGHIVDVAGCGIEGKNLALSTQYDAIVLDVMLPGMDGITLCRNLREAGCKTKPILMISARDTPDDKIVGLEAGADDYLVKSPPLRAAESRLRIVFL